MSKLGLLKIKVWQPIYFKLVTTPLLWTWIIIQRRSHNLFHNNEYRSWGASVILVLLLELSDHMALQLLKSFNKKRINCGPCSFCQSQWHFVYSPKYRLTRYHKDRSNLTAVVTNVLWSSPLSSLQKGKSFFRKKRKKEVLSYILLHDEHLCSMGPTSIQIVILYIVTIHFIVYIYISVSLHLYACLRGIIVLISLASLIVK